MNKAFEMFTKKLKEHQQNVSSTCQQIEVQFNSDDLDRKINLAQNLVANTGKLIEFGTDETPSWVHQLNQAAHAFISDKLNLQKRKNLIDLILRLKNEIFLHDWNLGGYQNNVNFEEIYSKYKSESRLTELFNELTDLLEKILSDSSIDLGESERKFKLLLTVVRSNMNRSFYGDQSVVSYLFYFIKEFLLNLSGNIPGLKEFIEALISTGEKIREEMETTRQKTENEIKSLVSMGGALGYNPDGTAFEIQPDERRKIDILT